MNVHLVGCSYHSASVTVRERLAFSSQQAGEALLRLRRQFPAAEAVVLSTCNRVEVYTAGEEPQSVPSHQQVAEFLAEFHGLEVHEIFDELFERSGSDAVRHLFTVAASLDSMVVGEPQILSQVRQAYQLATEKRSAGPLTHAIFQSALKVARRVVTETSVHRKRVSIPSVAVAEFAKDIFERFDDKRILVLGAGEMAEETLHYLMDEGARNVTIVNRSLQRAHLLADSVGGQVVPWGQLGAQLAAADLVVSTTGAPDPVVTLEEFRRVESARYQRPLCILDLAVPRDFDPSIGRCLGVYLYSIDDLRETCEQNRRDRDSELPGALRIIAEETDRFMADLHHQTTGPIIKRLRQNWHQIKEDELRRLFNKLPDLEDRSREEINRFSDRLVNKLLHPPLESLRDESRHGIPHHLVEAFKRLFQLKD